MNVSKIDQFRAQMLTKGIDIKKLDKNPKEEKVNKAIAQDVIVETHKKGDEVKSYYPQCSHARVSWSRCS